jgi:hypothetical protein
MIPVTGFHSTMDKPEWVNLVAPPNITIIHTRKQVLNSQKIRGLFWEAAERMVVSFTKV